MGDRSHRGRAQGQGWRRPCGAAPAGRWSVGGSERMIQDALPFDFPEKGRIVALLLELEAGRDRLCYGRPSPDDLVQASQLCFGELRRIFGEQGVNES